MASHGPDIPSKSSGKAPNRSGRPRKHITVEEAKERKVVKQKQKRLQQQQLRDSKAGHAIPKALQFIPYHPPSTGPSSSRSTSTVKDEQELYTSTESLRAGTFLRDFLPARAYRSRLSRILLVWRHHINTMTSAGLEKVLHLAAAQLLDFAAA
jgi:hypothetical protein